MAEQRNVISEGINYSYNVGGIELPDKIAPINDSNYHLIDSCHIDWNNSALSYIPKIQKDIFKQYKYLYFDEDGNVTENENGVLETRYHNDSKLNLNIDFSEIPLWKQDGTLKDSTELLDLVNYILSRIIHADDKILEFDQLLKLGKVYVEFQKNGLPDWINVNETLDKLLNSEIVIYPHLTEEENVSRSFIIEVHLKPKDKIFDKVNVQCSTTIYSPANITDKIVNIYTEAVESGDSKTPFYQLYKLHGTLDGFDKNFDKAEISFRITSERTSLWNSIDPMTFILTVKKDENPISKIIINDIEYIYISKTQYPEVFEQLSEKYEAIPTEYVLLQKNDLYDEQIKINDGVITIEWLEPGNDVVNPNRGSIEYCVENNLFFGVCSDNTPLSKKRIPLVNNESAARAKNTVKIYTKYPKRVGDNYLSKDVADTFDNDIKDTAVIRLTGSGVKINNEVLSESSIEIPGTWNSTEQCFEFNFGSLLVDEEKANAFMDIEIGGSKYIAFNKTLFSIPVLPINAIEIQWRFNSTIWNSIVAGLGENKEGFNFKYNDVDGVLSNLNLVLPLFTTKSFSGNTPEEKNEVIQTRPDLQYDIENLTSTNLNIWKINKNIAGALDGFVDVYPSNNESLNKTFQEKIEIDYSPIIREYNKDKNSPLATSLVSIFGKQALDLLIEQNDAETIGKRFIHLDYERDDSNEIRMHRLVTKAITNNPKHIKNTTNSNGAIFNNSDEADYFDLPINLIVAGGSVTDKNDITKTISWVTSKLPVNIRVIRGDNKLTGIQRKTTENGSIEALTCKLFEQLDFRNLYGARKLFASDTTNKWIFIGRNKRDNDPNVSESLRKPTLKLEYYDNDISTTTQENYLTFDWFNQPDDEFGTNKDDFPTIFWQKDNIKTTLIYASIWQDNEWHASNHNTNSNLLTNITISRLNRLIDAKDDKTNKILGIFKRFENSNPDLHKNLLEQDIKFYTDSNNFYAGPVTLGANDVYDIGWLKTITSFFNQNKTNKCFLRLDDIISNLPRNTEENNKNIKVIAKIIIDKDDDEVYWKTTFSSLNEGYVTLFETAPHHENIEISLDNVITINNIQELISKTQNGGNDDIIDVENIENTESVESIRIKIYVWVPYNKYFQGSLYAINWRLVPENEVGVDNDTYKIYGKQLINTFTNKLNKDLTYIKNDLSNLLLNDNLETILSKIINPYYYHILDLNGDGQITENDLETLRNYLE